MSLRSLTHLDYRKCHKLTRIARGTQQDVKWAGSPENSKRQYAVTELYPRLLCTFSGVVVFVLRNTKYLCFATLDVRVLSNSKVGHLNLWFYLNSSTGFLRLWRNR